MIFLIDSRDKPDHVHVRAAHAEMHRAHARSGVIDILAAGPQVEDDNETMIGSYFIVEAEDRAEVERFVADDPFNKAGLFASTEIRAIRKHMGRWS